MNLDLLYTQTAFSPKSKILIFKHSQSYHLDLSDYNTREHSETESKFQKDRDRYRYSYKQKVKLTVLFYLNNSCYIGNDSCLEYYWHCWEFFVCFLTKTKLTIKKHNYQRFLGHLISNLIAS